MCGGEKGRERVKVKSFERQKMYVCLCGCVHTWDSERDDGVDEKIEPGAGGTVSAQKNKIGVRRGRSSLQPPIKPSTNPSQQPITLPTWTSPIYQNAHTSKPYVHIYFWEKFFIYSPWSHSNLLHVTDVSSWKPKDLLRVLASFYLEKSVWVLKMSSSWNDK